ncbi:putative E3 ubiquitin ligase SUD1 [Cladorrhinum sp. PSN259]|nr:putative E3 ubiquitin ligase SUD1 [Cladorrhinum sp. PSN259]
MDDPMLHDRYHDEAFPNPDPARYPNTRLRDPFASSGHSRSSLPRTKADALDPDTCRICRGEGTLEEPLFYPCRCSGSIKHVHQDCLMEWLSHSQKKHCELCKTPFRFTKLYDPNMPKTLPWHVFTSHMTKLFFAKALVWLRAALVASVWLGWLPYLMRTVWAFLFWLSDEGVGSYFFFARQNGTGFDADASSTTIPFSATCPASPLVPETTTLSSRFVPLGPGQLAKGAAAVRDAVRDSSFATTILRLLFGPASLAEKPAPTAFNASMTAVAIQRTSSSPTSGDSLLSGVGFLRNLTRHRSINRVVIATLEGQIVTILVIVCFILIILVRDYVVQQQPEINMRAAFAAAENDVQVVQQAALQQPMEAEHVEEPESAPDFPEEDTRAAYSQGEHDTPAIPEGSLIGQLDHPIFGTNRFDEKNAILEYMGIYREANGNPARILEIAQERNLEVKLEAWMQLTRSMLERTDTAADEQSDFGSATENTPSSSTGARHVSSNVDTSGSPKAPDQPHEWDWPSGSKSQHHGKGKEAATGGFDEHEEAIFESMASPLRPRANTDGPKISDTIHPLANNSWSFANLPHEESLAGPSMFSWNHETEPEEVDDTRLTPESTNTPSSPVPDRLARSPSPTLPRFGETQRNVDDMGPPLVEPFPLLPEDPEDFLPQQQLPQVVPLPPPPPRRQPVGLAERLADFMWGDMEAVDPADLAAGDAAFGMDDADDLAGDEEDDDVLQNDMQQDQGAGEAAVAAALDPEAIEDAEDLEGILELLGMRGPVAGLFQNAIFCAFLVSITVFLGIVVPYNVGRITVWTIANPLRPARILFSFCMFVQDFAMVVVGFASWLVSQSLQVLSQAFRLKLASDYMAVTVASSRSMMVSAINRVGNSFVAEFTYISGSEIRNFSAISHEALVLLKGRVALGFTLLVQALAFILGGNYATQSSEVASMAANASVIVLEGLKELPRLVANPNSWVLNLSLPEPTATTFNPELAHWSGADRFLAIAVGYLTMSIMAGVYLRRGSPFFTGPTAQEWEASIIDALNQASGVMKVILIIGIEMLVFPLYCGMLLDLALLPLFEDTTIKSRLLFTLESPLTSIFVHWFVGTGYMFHFALFVSMCRKIMRKGVLYFIRDPDDPEFHPVRDVLERNVTTQLRKILFSAFVYGALVVVCLGGVVWGLAACFSTVLPIHYSSNEPVLEFPLDLVFYNFVLPLWFRYSKPSDALHLMYTWWFQKCARMLRVTWFLFGERRIDEEGVLVLPKDSPDHSLPWWRKLFLEVDWDGQVRAMSWSAVLRQDSPKPEPTPADGVKTLSEAKRALVESNQLIPDGRYVRAPASDQVKIPKGRLTFLNVDEDNARQDGRQDLREADIYSSDHYQQVYVPPHFRLRVFLFITFIWIFAAITGVALTIVPLVFGRWMFKSLIPGHIRTNDIYAFSIGAYILGTAIYALWHARSIYAAVKAWAANSARAVVDGQAVWKALHVCARALKVAYTYTFFYIVFPFLVAALIELYVLIPLHEVRYSSLLRGGVAATTTGAADEAGASATLNPRHTVRVIQTWTIGFLYIKVARHILARQLRNTRPAQALVAVWRRGLGDPDASLFSRAFVVPGLTIWLFAVSVPLLAASLVVSNGWIEAIIQASSAAEADHEVLRQAYRVLIYRLSFPVVMGLFGTLYTLWSMVGLFETYRVRIRDEAYLIGERLHNFGVSVHGGNGTPNKGKGNANPAWRAGAGRVDRI